MRQRTYISDYTIEPPLPEDPFTYAVKQIVQDVLTSGSPFVEERTVVIDVPLDTAVWVRELSGNGFLPLSKRVTTLKIAARARVLRYGGHPYLYGGFVDLNPPDILPLEVLEWRFEVRWMRYETYPDAHRNRCYERIVRPPGVGEVCKKEGLPELPRLGTIIPWERFYFTQWLSNPSCTERDVAPLYEKVLMSHREERERYRAIEGQQDAFYQKWLDEHGVCLPFEDVGKYLQDEALPQATRLVSENARRVLEEADHLELLE